MVKTGMERTSIYTSADFDLTDNIRFVSDASFNRRETSVQVAGYFLQRMKTKWGGLQPQGTSHPAQHGTGEEAERSVGICHCP